MLFLGFVPKGSLGKHETWEMGSWGFGVNPNSGTNPAIAPEAARDAGWPQTPSRNSAYVPSYSARALATWGEGGMGRVRGVGEAKEARQAI